MASVRRAAGITQRDVAAALGVGEKTVSHWERGRYPAPWYVQAAWPALVAEVASRRAGAALAKTAA